MLVCWWRRAHPLTRNTETRVLIGITHLRLHAQLCRMRLSCGVEDVILDNVIRGVERVKGIVEKVMGFWNGRSFVFANLVTIKKHGVLL